MDPSSGLVSTNGPLDREITEVFSVPIYVTDFGTRRSSGGGFGDQGAQFDVAMLTVQIIDVNDHAPEFRTGACYPLAVPENGDLAVIHTVVASDADSGVNGEITYSITGTIYQMHW